MADMGFGKSDKELATIFNISVSDVKRIKAEVRKEITKPSLKKPSASKKELLPLKGKEAVLKEYQKSISPKGMAKTKAEQTAALDALMKKRYGKKK